MLLSDKHLPRDDHAAWAALLNQWGTLLDRYEQLTRADQDPDVGWWHSEQALTGLLAAAAWQMNGGIGLVEFSTERTRGDGKTKEGWGDAWIRLPNGQWYAVEAKLSWDSDVEAIDWYLDEAKTDLVSLREKDHAGMALCYWVPSYPHEVEPPTIVPQLAAAASKRFTESLVAGYIPEGGAWSYEERYYPGMILIGRPHRWQHGVAASN